MKLHFLTNPSDITEQKMRFFTDYFSYVNQFIGSIPDLPFDNPTSFTNKILFQLENNVHRSPLYIDCYFTQLLKYYKKYLEENTSSFAQVLIFYNQYKDLPKKQQVPWLKNDISFKNALAELYTELEDGLFDKMFSLLNNYMICIHDVNEHKMHIMFATQILVSIYRHDGFTKKDIDEFVSRILSTDRRKFPFPLEVYEKNRGDEYCQLADNYIENRDFIKQFEGLRNIRVNYKARNGHFLYVIDNCNLNDKVKDEFKIIFDRVTFITPSHASLIELRQSVEDYDREKGRDEKIFSSFFEGNKLLAYVKLNYDQKDSARDIGLKLVQDKIVPLNQYLGTELTVNSRNYLFTEQFDEYWFSSVSLFSQKNDWVSDDDYNVAKNNPFEQLKDISSLSKEQILHNENTFIKAKSEDDISSFWQYIENLFWTLDIETSEVRTRVVDILMANLDKEFRDMIWRIGFLFNWNSLDGHYDQIGIDAAASNEIFRGGELGDDTHLFLWEKDIRHSFLSWLIVEYRELKSPSYQQEWRDFFHYLLVELYDFRNAETHSGKANDYSRIKLADTIPILINRVRWDIIHRCKNNPNLTYEELLNL